MGVVVEVDIITVAHNDVAYDQARQVINTVYEFHPGMNITAELMDNRVENIGFARACNRGAKLGSAPIIGFLNPDVTIRGPFLQQVARTFTTEQVVITGQRFGKPQFELDIWGVREWVCGAVMFVKRDFWEQVDGFDEQFVWSHEETDLIRRAETMGYVVRPCPLAIEHRSPDNDTDRDAAYKKYWFNECQRRYVKKWRKW